MYFNYCNLLVSSPAVFGVWFNYPIFPVTPETYFESDTYFGYIYASVTTPFKVSSNVTATTKLEYSKNGFDNASLKFIYIFCSALWI